MRTANCALIAALALLSSTGLGSGQTQNDANTAGMTRDQQRSIFMRVTRDQMTMAPQPSYWAPQIGADVPADIELYDMPRTIDAPTLRSARYTVINGEVVIVDKQSRRVLYVIEND